MVNVMKGGGRAPPPSPAWANFTLMMECTPESSRCNSMYSVGVTTVRLSHSPIYRTVLLADPAWLPHAEKSTAPSPSPIGDIYPQFRNNTEGRVQPSCFLLCGEYRYYTFIILQMYLYSKAKTKVTSLLFLPPKKDGRILPACIFNLHIKVRPILPA